MTKYKQQETMNGQSLFELVVAIAISAMIIVAIVGLVTNSIRNSIYSRNESLASDYAQKTIEWLRGERDTNIQDFLDRFDTGKGGSLVYCFKDVALNWNYPTLCDGEVIIDTIFSREGNFLISTDPGTGKTFVEAKISVSWDDSQGNHKVVNTTNFTDWRQR